MARPAWPPPITSTSRAGVADTGVIGPAPGRAEPDSRLRRAESGKGQVLAYATSAWLRVRRYRGPEQRGKNPNPSTTNQAGLCVGRTWKLRRAYGDRSAC